MASRASRFLDAARSLVRADASAPSPPVAHVDAAEDYSGATISNGLSGLGGARDSGASGRPNLARDFLSEEELIALLRGTLYRRIIEMHPKWATTKGLSITDDTKDDRPLAKEFKRLGLLQAFRQADKWGRALGESRILLVTDDPSPLHEPLDPQRVKRLIRLEVLDRREFSPASYNGDASLAELGLPETYHVFPRRSGVAYVTEPVHRSRLLRFYGDDLPPSERGYNWTGYSTWGADAIGQTLWDGLRNLSQTGLAGARLAQELSIAVFKMANAAPKSSSDERSSFLSRLATLNMMKSIANAVWLGPGDTFERIAANPSGFRDLSEHAQMELALMIGAPRVLLFGDTPGGLNSDGESWQTMWFSDVASHQEERYREPAEYIAQILYWSTAGAVPDEWSLDFAPLGEMGDRERAEVRKLHTEADALAIDAGILRPEDARSRYEKAGGFSLEIQPVEEGPEGFGVEAEESAREMVAAIGDRRDAATHKVPEAARNNARKVLRWREEHPDEIRGMTEVGWRRARQLANNAEVGIDTVRKMAAFNRHRSNAEVAEEFKAEPWRDAGYVAWLGWGGTTGIDWARRITGAADAIQAPEPRRDAEEGAVWIGMPLPESARRAWEQARQAVGAAVPVSQDDPPHVTVLYMGQVSEQDVAEVLAAAEEAAEHVWPCEARAEHLALFGDAVVMPVQAWGLMSLHEALLPRLAHLVTARQFPSYRPHLTLGYAAEPMTPEQQGAVLETAVPEIEWQAARVEVRRGGELVGTVVLKGAP